jgi:hypothetical protein
MSSHLLQYLKLSKEKEKNAKLKNVIKNEKKSHRKTSKTKINL